MGKKLFAIGEYRCFAGYLIAASALMMLSHPIIIITPEFYNQEIPCCIKQFHVGDGIYVIPSYSSINSSEITYNSKVMSAVVRCV